MLKANCTWLPKPLAALAQIIFRGPSPLPPPKSHGTNAKNMTKSITSSDERWYVIWPISKRWPKGSRRFNFRMDTSLQGRFWIGRHMETSPQGRPSISPRSSTWMEMAFTTPRAATVPGLMWMRAPLALRDLQTSCMGTRPIFGYSTTRAIPILNQAGSHLALKFTGRHGVGMQIFTQQATPRFTRSTSSIAAVTHILTSASDGGQTRMSARPQTITWAVM